MAGGRARPASVGRKERGAERHGLVSLKEVADATRARRLRKKPAKHRTPGERAFLAEWEADHPFVDELDDLRPRDRSECRGQARPCPWVGCKYHLYLDVNPGTGSIKLNFPGLEVHQLEETCALDVADRTAITLARVGGLMNLVREAVRLIETRAMMRISPQLAELHDDDFEPTPTNVSEATVRVLATRTTDEEDSK